MAEKNFWQDKWLKDQYNERNPGQRSDPTPRPAPTPEAPKTADPDDVLRVMLNTPPQPHKPAVEKPKTKAKKKLPK